MKHPHTTHENTFVWLLCCCLLALLFAACDEPGDSDRPDVSEADEELGQAYRYEIYLQDGIADTLSGPAAFGHVVDASGQEKFVIELQDSESFTDGMVLVRNEKSFEEGSHDVIAQDADGDGFRVVYRKGMLREFAGISGEVDLTTVTDTLLEGQVDIRLEGWYVLPGESEEEGQIRARGAFRATQNEVGFIVGL